MPDPEESVPDTLNIIYPLEEFARDFQAYGEISEHAEEKDTSVAVYEYFTAHAPSPVAAMDRMLRCCAAAAYWERHRDALDQGKLSVVGRNRALVSSAVVFALWACWCRPDCDPLRYDPPIDAFVTVCQGLARRQSR